MLNAFVSRTVGATIVAAAIAGCGTPSKVTDQWRDPTYAAGPMTRVAVIGVDLPPATRNVVEDRFASELAKKDVQATPSYRIFGDQLPAEAETRAALAQRGYQGALVLRLQRIAEKPRYVPGSYYGGMYGGYGYGWGPMYYSPGYYVVDEIVNFEASLWDLRDGKRVWTANTRTTNPSSSGDFAKSLSKKVVPELAEQGFLAED